MNTTLDAVSMAALHTLLAFLWQSSLFALVVLAGTLFQPSWSFRHRFLYLFTALLALPSIALLQFLPPFPFVARGLLAFLPAASPGMAPAAGTGGPASMINSLTFIVPALASPVSLP